MTWKTHGPHRRNNKSECQECTCKMDKSFNRGMFNKFESRKVCVAVYHCDNSEFDFWLICLTETSFSSSKSAMYARCSSLKVRVKTMRGKWISQTFLTDHSNQVRQTNWFSCHKRLCFHSLCINYLLFFEMYFIYKEQAYLAALKAANRLSKSNTIRTKLLEKVFPIMSTFLRNKTISKTTPLRKENLFPQYQCCFPQTSRDQAFFWMHNNIAFRGRGRGKNRYSYDV